MSRSEARARPSPAAAAAWGATAAITWRAAWRQGVFAVEWGMLLVEALLGSIAAIGSPSAAAGSVQMLAVVFAIVPFAVCLPTGSLVRASDVESYVWTRPVDPWQDRAGRALGLAAVTGVLLAGTAVFGAVATAVVAHLPFLPSLGWDLVLSLLYAGPSAVLWIGVCVWLMTVLEHPRTYYAVVIPLALSNAFFAYKLVPAVSHLWPGAFAWAPFPALLTLGLAPPPRLLNLPVVPAWVAWNRILYVALGVAFLLASGLPLARRVGAWPERFPRRLAALGLGCLAALGIGAERTAAWGSTLAVTTLSPAAWRAVRAVAPASYGAGTRVDLVLRLNPDGAGLVSGTVRLSAVPAQSGRLVLAENAGLDLTRVRVNGQPVRCTAVAGLVPETAARLWYGPPVRKGQRLTIAVHLRGRVAPLPSFLPYPPFGPSDAPEPTAVGHGRVFLWGGGTLWPRLVVRSGQQVSEAVTGRIRVTALLRGSEAWGSFPVRQESDAVTLAIPAGSRARDVALVVAPRSLVQAFGGVSVLAPGHVGGSAQSVFVAYARALQAAARWDPAVHTLAVVRDPVLTEPVLAGGLLLGDGRTPYCTPTDPVSGRCGGAPPLRRAVLVSVATWAWQEVLDVPAVGPWPVEPATGRRTAALERLAAALGSDVGGSLGCGTSRRAVAAFAPCAQSTLSPRERTLADALWPAVRAAQPGELRALASRVWKAARQPGGVTAEEVIAWVRALRPA